MVIKNTKILLAGLGNLPYPATRHSVGHVVIDSLASRLGVRLKLDKAIGGFSAQTEVAIGGNSVDLTLFKPSAFMNITGRPVADALRSIGKSPSSLIVIHDSLEHEPATVSAKSGGTAAGHNGVRSIITALGGDRGFHRLRIGIGRGKGDVAEYVLDKLPSYERQYWSSGGQGIDLVWTALENIVEKVARSPT